MIRGVLIDLSGTLHIEDIIIPGAVSALAKLRSHGIAVKFLTNTTKESRNYLYNRLVSLGFGIEKQEIFTSLNAARTLIDQRNLRCHFIVDQNAMEDFEGVNTSDPNAVVVGLAPEKFEYDNMNEAFRLLLDGAELIAIHKARYYKTKDGLSVGPGAFVTGLEYATRKEAIVVGKPSKAFFELGLNAIGSDITPQETVMIGDDVNDDVLGAINAGMKGILVKTGKYKKDDENKIPEEKRNCVDSFVEAVDHIVSGRVL